MKDRVIHSLWPCLAALLMISACDKVTGGVSPPPQKVTTYTSLKLTQVGEGECWARAGATLTLAYVEGEYVVLRHAGPADLSRRDGFSPACPDGATVVMTGETYVILDHLYTQHLAKEREEQELREAARRFAEQGPSGSD